MSTSIESAYPPGFPSMNTVYVRPARVVFGGQEEALDCWASIDGPWLHYHVEGSGWVTVPYGEVRYVEWR